MGDQNADINFVCVVGGEKPQIISVEKLVTREFDFNSNPVFGQVKALFVVFVVGNRHFLSPATAFKSGHECGGQAVGTLFDRSFFHSTQHLIDLSSNCQM
ncbi:MAG: hypothetical protein FD161_4049 [Limisphaerales bacterium]|nr:MAG: hypothetical protein FD161_4049 [Limisphaerales bacterium]KAG0507258.1 MAG: hypothetical protein E1N63_3601 [Limisphaerales bacterium]